MPTLLFAANLSAILALHLLKMLRHR